MSRWTLPLPHEHSAGEGVGACEGVGDDAQALGCSGLRQAQCAGVGGAGDQQAPGHQPVSEVDECRLEGLRRAVAVEVVGLDVGDDLHARGVVEEGAVGLIGLGDQGGSAAQVGAGAQGPHDPADGEGGVGSGLREGLGEHARGRGLAVRTRHGDEVQALRGQGQRLGAVDDVLAPPAGPSASSGLVSLDRGGDHNSAPLGNVRGVMPQVGRDAQIGQMVEGGTPVGVGAGDLGAAGREQLSDHAHSRSPDADEVEGPACQGAVVAVGRSARGAGGVLGCGGGHAAFSSSVGVSWMEAHCRMRAARRAAASWTPVEAAPADWRPAAQGRR